MVGQQAWQRTGAGAWTVPVNLESAWGMVQPYLPAIQEVPEPLVREEGELAILTWYDVGRNADVTLEVDPATGTPMRLTRVARADNATLTVIYHAWNTPVEITPPFGT